LDHQNRARVLSHEIPERVAENALRKTNLAALDYDDLLDRRIAHRVHDLFQIGNTRCAPATGLCARLWREIAFTISPGAYRQLSRCAESSSSCALRRLTPRQLLYPLRPIVMAELGAELKLSNFTSIIDDYEADHGEIPGMYREPRGSIYHPHRSETITLGTLMVEDYERPEWTFNKAVYIEKEGFGEALKDARWAERHDCMLMSSKGFTSRAAKDLVDKLAEHDEPVTIFCVHDADAAGTLIYQTFQEATKARREARKIKIVDLGLQPWEAIAMGLEVEEVEQGKKRKPVAGYVTEREDVASNGEAWEEWLQTHRIELNAMSTPRFIAWLDGKMADQSKLVPPADVLTSELTERVTEKLQDDIREQILREAGFEERVAEAIAATEKPDAAALEEGVRELFKREPDREWRDHIEAVANLKTGDGR
jgi:Topoisomerase 6 subunit A/Spo11, Toprim domain